MAERDTLSTMEPVGGLDERVLSTLQGLPGRIAFSGLRRVLGVHPESLSRSLRRLEREGLVDHSPVGYRALGEAPKGGFLPASELRPIAQVEVPLGTPPDSVLGRLSGRWFGSLRWVGVVEGPSGQMLVWARRDGDGYVLLGIERNLLRVFVRGAVSEDDPSEAEESAYELLVHAVGALRPSARGAVGTVTFYAADRPGPEGPLEN